MADHIFGDDEMAQFYTRRTPKPSETPRVVMPSGKHDARKSAAKKNLEKDSTLVLPGQLDAEPQMAPRKAANAAPGQAEVRGFLFSVSHRESGEWWLLHEGSNTIGRFDGCDVVLQEATVENMHATLNVRRTEKGLSATLADMHNGQGTLLNGLPVGTTARECHDRDTLTIGGCYELLLMLADTRKYGLSVKDSFREPGAEQQAAPATQADDDGTVFGGFGAGEDDATRIV